MPDLAELAAALLPGARWVGEADGRPAGAPITWVRVMRPRVPAFDALDPGDLAIVPAAALAVVAPGRDELRSFVVACLAARLSGLLLVEGDAPGEAPEDAPAASPGLLDALAAALIDARLPAIRIPRADVAALERSVIGFLVTGGAELDRQAAQLEARLERLALEGGGPAALVAAIATFLGRAVALEGRRGDALAVHAPLEVEDSVAAVARYHARPRQAVALRVSLPATTGPAGSLALLGERPVVELERVAIARIAGILALELARDEAVRRARDQARRAEALPAGGPPWVVLLARQRIPGAEDDSPAARERREALRRELRLIAPARRMALRGDADSLEIRAVLTVDPAGGSDLEGLVLATRLATFLDRSVAVSRPFSSPLDRPAAEAEARATLEHAESLAEPPRVARAARLPVYRLLGGLHNLPDGERLSRALLEPLLAGRADVRREHLATLRALLDHGGVNEAAAALGVHRNTVAYRLRRIEELTGWRLSDPEIRLPLSVALRLVQDD
ncbi:MAG TPA: helix-turn-helix domain-containing protein [Candidatus Sulfomarinibacteraceae bacterium]|nr:helix-turn-helix domain-containing protein [Candidatus Sulfomarinibacteraceae bacterium]